MIMLCSALFFIIFFIPFHVFAQQPQCKDILNRCINVNEAQYNNCTKSCKSDDIDIVYGLICEILGYKAGSSKWYECIDKETKECLKECKKYYNEGTEFCYESNKKCRKGDIFGHIHMSISYVSDQSESTFITGSASFNILGFWKFQTKESNEYIKNYRPENLQIIALLRERAIAQNDEYPYCPKLLWNFQGGVASGLSVETNVDYQQNPLGRFVLYNLPKPSKFAPKDIAKIVSPFYQVGSLGTIVSINGRKRAGDSPPQCFKYNPAIYKVRFGKFLISDNIKTSGEMSGSESWESCGNDAIEMGADESGNHIATISFEIEKDKISMSEGESHIKWPGKHEGRCRDNLKGNIRVQWKFNVIK